MAAADARLTGWMERFRKVPLAREVVTGLEGRAEDIWRRTFDLLRKESAEYRNAVDDEFTAESKIHCGELLETIIGIASGRRSGSDPFGFVRRHAEWRARHQVPLVASLHAYRLAHKTYWGITREVLAELRKRKEVLEALAVLSDFWIELFEAVGAALEESHGAEEARIVAQNTPLYAGIMDDLLHGTDPVGAEARQLLTLCGMRPPGTMTVAIIRPLPADNGSYVDVEVTLRSLMRLLHQALPSSVFGKLTGLRNGEIVIIANSDNDTSGRLLKHLGRDALGRRAASIAMGAGVGLDKLEVAHLPTALAEARMAFDFAAPGRALQRFADIDLAEFVIRRADRAALRLIPQWVLEAYTTGRERDLIHTIRAFAECSLSVKETARRLGVHANTVYFRLNQIKKRTGADPRTFAGTSLLLTSLRLLDSYGQNHGNQQHNGTISADQRGVARVAAGGARRL
jgi:DNA-binding CsgD family transcriptional regulator